MFKSAAPKGYNTVTTYLVVKNAQRIIDFTRKAFKAVVREHHLRPDGKLMHAEIQIGDTRLMIADIPRGSKAIPAMFYLYVSDCDAVYKQAIKAGGKSVRKPADQPYGDRSGAVRDAAGNQWWLATKLNPARKSRRKAR